ncbi:MAG: DHH family phosphoesterase [Clostridia bacterium]|nr:DHH family phosphoesterase [Deltaproteobacteria bacterium]
MSPPRTAVSGQFRPPARQLRPRDIGSCVEAASCLPIDPKVLKVPEALLDKIRGAQKVLIVAHTNPDIDAIGSALSLAALTRHLKKRVDVCIDDTLGFQGSKLDYKSDIKRAGALAGKAWDVAIVVDVAASRRIGGGWALLERADHVVVVDHHHANRNDDIIQRCREKCTAWVDGDLDASALQVAAIASRLLTGLTLTKAEQRAIYGPALAGIWTDTRAGSRDNMQKVTPAIFKHCLIASGLTIPKVIDSFATKIPQRLRDLANDNRSFAEVPHEDIMILRAPAEAYKDFGDQVYAIFPQASDRDVVNILRERAERWMHHGHKCVALVVEPTNGRVLVSLRAANGSARHIANALGGNGHDAAAAATVYGQNLDDVIRWVQQLAEGKQQTLKRQRAIPVKTLHPSQLS